MSYSYLVTESCLLDKNLNPIEGSIQFISYLQKLNLPFRILSNQSMRSLETLARKYQERGFAGLEKEHFYTTALGGIDLLRAKFPKQNVAGYIGTKALKELLQEKGFSVNLDYADYVFIGTDYQASFNDYSYVLSLLEKGATLLSTNDDLIEVHDGKNMIGPGAIVKMLEAASNKKALSLDMPTPNVALQAIQSMEVFKEDVIFVGGNLDKEIACGKKAGLKTVLLTAAVDETENVFLNEIQPDFAIESLMGLLQ